MSDVIAMEGPQTVMADAPAQAAPEQEPAAPQAPQEPVVSQAKANAMVASARKKLESQLAKEAQARAELAEQLEELQAAKGGKPDTERQLEKLQAKLQAAVAEAEKAKADALGVKKDMAMAKINGEIGWAEGIGEEARNALVSAKFGALDLDDLTDADIVAPLVSEFRESNPWAVAGSAAAGAGAKPGAAVVNGRRTVSRSELNTLAKSNPDEYMKQSSALWKGVSDGTITLVA